MDGGRGLILVAVHVGVVRGRIAVSGEAQLGRTIQANPCLHPKVIGTDHGTTAITPVVCLCVHADLAQTACAHSDWLGGHDLELPVLMTTG